MYLICHVHVNSDFQGKCPDFAVFEKTPRTTATLLSLDAQAKALFATGHSIFETLAATAEPYGYFEGADAEDLELEDLGSDEAAGQELVSHKLETANREGCAALDELPACIRKACDEYAGFPFIKPVWVRSRDHSAIQFQVGMPNERDFAVSYRLPPGILARKGFVPELA